MATLDIPIQGRNFQIACDDGQESHVRHLARDLDSRLSDFRHRAGKTSPDGMLLLLVALTLCDEINTLKGLLKEQNTQASPTPAHAPAAPLSDLSQTLLLEITHKINHFSTQLEEMPLAKE